MICFLGLHCAYLFLLTALFETGGANARYLEASAEIMHRMGTQTTEKALRNWPKMANALCPLGESGLVDDFFRFADLRQALKLETSQGQKVLVDLLEGIDVKTAQQLIDDGVPMPASFKDLYPTMYHYADGDTVLNYADDLIGGIEGKWRLRENPIGRYVGVEDITSQATASGRFQLPLTKQGDAWVPDPTKGRFKCVASAPDDLRLARASRHSVDTGAGDKQWLEIIVKDNPNCGGGDAFQCKSKVPVEVQVIDLKTGQVVRDRTHLQQLLSQ